MEPEFVYEVEVALDVVDHSTGWLVAYAEEVRTGKVWMKPSLWLEIVREAERMMFVVTHVEDGGAGK